MDLYGLLVFATVFGLACAAPGPTVAALVARVLGRGLRGAPAFCAGLLLSDLVWLSAAVFGLAAVAAAAQPVFLAIKYLGVLYLIHLAWKLWNAPAISVSDVEPVPGEGVRLFFAGLAVALGNPKTTLFYLALLPTVVPLEAISAGDYLALVATVVVVYGGILTAYVLLASRARRAITSPRAMRIVNRTTGAVMAGAAVAVATRT